MAADRRILLKLAAVLALMSCLTTWFLMVGERPSCTLADGSILAIESVRYGRTNVFLDGSGLEKALRWVLPTNGVKLVKWQLQRPVERRISSSDGEIMALRLSFSRSEQSRNALFGDSRIGVWFVVLESESGHRYVSYLEPFDRTRNPEEFHSYLTYTAFPRERKRLTLDFLDRSGTSVTRLNFKNPAWQRQRRPSLTPVSPRTNVHGVDIDFGEIQLPPAGSALTDGRLPLAAFPIRMASNGMAVTNWTITDVMLRDAAGNFERWNPRKTIINDLPQYEIAHYLDPSEPWRVDFSLTQDADFNPAELCVLRLAYPIPLRRERFGEYTLEIRARDVLFVTMSPTNSNVRLTFVSARDSTGAELWPITRDWAQQHHFGRQLRTTWVKDGEERVSLPSDGTTLTLTFAIHTNYHASVILPPAKH